MSIVHRLLRYFVSPEHFRYMLNNTEHYYGIVFELESMWVRLKKEEVGGSKFKLNGSELGVLFKIWHLLKSSI